MITRTEYGYRIAPLHQLDTTRPQRTEDDMVRNVYSQLDDCPRPLVIRGQGEYRRADYGVRREVPETPTPWWFWLLVLCLITPSAAVIGWYLCDWIVRFLS